nr:hypothetical protein [Tanacetum cinerariifolium]
MEEYIKLQEEKALSLAIVFDDTLTSDEALSWEPTVSPLNNNEIEFRVSFDKNSFSYKIISVDNLKMDSENGNDKVNMSSSPSPEPTACWLRSERVIPDKGDLRDNWIEISSNKDFLGPTPPYVYIRDPEHGPRDGHHRISVAQYLFRYAEGRKSGARLFGGHFIGRLAAHFGLVSDAGLRERQQVTVAGAPKAAEDAPIDVEGDLAILTPVQVAQPPLAARTISQRLARLEEDVHRIQIGLGELPDSQRLLQIHHVGSRRFRQRTGDASTTTAQQDEQQPEP